MEDLKITADALERRQFKKADPKKEESVLDQHIEGVWYFEYLREDRVFKVTIFKNGNAGIYVKVGKRVDHSITGANLKDLHEVFADLHNGADMTDLMFSKGVVVSFKDKGEKGDNLCQLGIIKDTRDRYGSPKINVFLIGNYDIEPFDIQDLVYEAKDIYEYFRKQHRD